MADFDVLVLNFATFEEPNGVPREVSEGLPTREQIARLLFSPQSEVIVLGSPDLTLEKTGGGNLGVGWWLPFRLDVHREYGNEIHVVDSEFAFYFAHVSQWTTFVRGKLHRSIDLGDYAKVVTQEGHTTSFSLKPIAQTRFGEAIAFLISMSIDYANGYPLSKAGPIVWLPRADRITAHEAVEIILRVRYSVLVETEAPDWAESFTLPREEIVREEISSLNEQIVVLKNSLEEAHKRLRNESRFRALLFERGDALEPLVRDAFKELGAAVEERPRDREDGRLTDASGRRAILEIKGRTGPAKLADIRQLHQWVGDAIADEEWEGKGILVVNAFADSPIGERAAPFPSNSVRAAERFDQCLLTTTQLFTAIRAKQEGAFDSDAFWNTIFETTGVCALPDLSEAVSLAPEVDKPDA